MKAIPVLLLLLLSYELSAQKPDVISQLKARIEDAPYNFKNFTSSIKYDKGSFYATKNLSGTDLNLVAMLSDSSYRYSAFIFGNKLSFKHARQLLGKWREWIIDADKELAQVNTVTEIPGSNTKAYRLIKNLEGNKAIIVTLLSAKNPDNRYYYILLDITYGRHH